MEKGESLKSEYMDTSLKSDFSYPGYDEWKASALSSLKGKNFEKVLKTKTYEGITLDPLYDKKDIEGLQINSLPGSENFLRGQRAKGNLGTGWNVCQRMGSGIPETFNKELAAAINAGQNTVFISTDRLTTAGIDPEAGPEDQVCSEGLSLSVLEDISEALNGINLDKYPLVFDTNISGMELFMLLNSFFKEKGIDPNSIRIDLNVDPLGYLAVVGNLDADPSFYFKKMAHLIRKVKRDKLKIRAVGVSALPYHNAGASSVQELAIALATGVEYIEAMKGFGISPAETASSISFKFGIGPDYFMEIAKLRSGRVLWNRIQEEYGIPEIDRCFHVHSETSMFNQSTLDPYVNMLRITTEAFSAIAGGADALTTNPFNKTYSKSDEFSRRVARNVQMILKEESHLHKLIDPAGGSYFVEKLTAGLSKMVWDLFLEIEDQGGIQQALENGYLSQKIGEGKEKLGKLIANRKKVMVGINNYGNPDEVLAGIKQTDPGTDYSQRIGDLKKYKEEKSEERKSISGSTLREAFVKDDPELIDEGIRQFSLGASLGEISSELTGGTKAFTIKGLDMSRLPEPMESLRQRVDAMKSRPGVTSVITIAVNEPFLKIKPRGDFSKSFFETGGFNTSMIRVEGGVDDKVEKIVEEGNRLIVLCASDEDYPEIVPSLVEAIKRKMDDPVFILAGDPGDNREMYLKSGVDFFIYRGIDLPEIVSGVLESAGVDNG